MFSQCGTTTTHKSDANFVFFLVGLCLYHVAMENKVQIAPKKLMYPRLCSFISTPPFHERDIIRSVAQVMNQANDLD